MAKATTAQGTDYQQKQNQDNNPDLDSIAATVGTLVETQECRPNLSKEVLKTADPMTKRKQAFMGKLAMRHD